VKTAHDMGREFRVLSKLHPAYPEAPGVLLFCDDISILGAPFYLMERIQGIILRKDPPPSMNFPAETARRLSELFLDNLARLHALDYRAIGLGELGKPEGYLERQVRGWIGRYHASRTHDFPEVQKISDWLLARIPANSQAALLHNDYKYDNLILDPGGPARIRGVLDWEMSTLGDPLSDLGTALAYWVDANDPEDLQSIRTCPSNYPGSLTRAELVRRYARSTARDVSSIAYYLAFARFKVAVIYQQIFYRFQQGLTKDPRFAVLSVKVHALLKASLRGAQAGDI